MTAGVTVRWPHVVLPGARAEEVWPVFWRKKDRRRPARGTTDRHALVPIPLTGGVLSSQVRDGRGGALHGTEISVIDGGDRRVAHLDTDPFGRFAASLMPGQYRVRVDAGGYQQVTDVVEVSWGQHADMGTIVLGEDPALRPPRPGLFVIDPDHSSVRFVARHIGLSKVYGRFNRFQGRIRIAEPFEESSVDVVIDSASVDTNADARDTHLRSADFLDVERFPELRFSSVRFAAHGGNRWTVDGDLTLHGLTSDVSLDTTFLGSAEWNGDRVGAIATGQLHREHYTLNWQQTIAKGLPVVGSTIEIQLDVQAVRQG
ncbi:YceI family protein [Pseudonocardia sp. Ae168_Ps1]|uniref:YceI family protein n=1 Tax=unclassified Pseudonocardia TaxID=2619320 RepID=UPI00095CBE54|nr:MULTISPECIES: YceI family protein [unclassified Pseudonocardia]OLL76742.1 YceI family protein [Pseudonocardia sp. Ae150A_Ps1]OLL82754.1 YceI family protein [Pseudonocardia sp. Ae168_Ps1]OLL83133.1 YceI family protein [Pseudonocardia sp. Ae263_Ps1]OLL90829.1 YceI family protein [Pseudonocardia sp. Ae356_Ps1]